MRAYQYSFQHTGADSSGAFWVTVPLGVRLRGPPAFSMHLAVETETSLPAAPEFFCRSPAETGEMLREPVAAVGSSLFRPRPRSAANDLFSVHTFCLHHPGFPLADL